MRAFLFGALCAAVLVAPVACISESSSTETGSGSSSWVTIGNSRVERIVDEEYGVVCYQKTYSDRLSCVKVK